MIPNAQVINRVNELRRKFADGSITLEEQKEAILLLRQDRTSALTAAAASKKKSSGGGGKKKPDATSLLNELDNL